MNKIALFSVIAVSALMVGCSSTQTRSDNGSMEGMKECNMEKGDQAKACPTEAKKKMDCGKMGGKKGMDCDKMGGKKDCGKMGDKKAMDCGPDCTMPCCAKDS